MMMIPRRQQDQTQPHENINIQLLYGKKTLTPDN